jgi:hypothetical protein
MNALEAEWTRLRTFRTNSPPVNVPTPANDNPLDREIVADIAFDRFDELAWIRYGSVSTDPLEHRRWYVEHDPEGRKEWNRVRMARGELTALRPAFDEWLPTRASAKSGFKDYTRGAKLLCERFDTIEEISHKDAQSFLVDLLKKYARPTVQKFRTAYVGLWKFHGHETAMWTLENLKSAIPSVRREQWSDDEYVTLLRAAKQKGDRRLFLAIRIAAYTGAAAGGIAGLEYREPEGAGPSLFLPETKQDHRPRIIPCHPVIRRDVKEWLQDPFDANQLSTRFGNLKKTVGFGYEKVLHFFRHSVMNKLDNLDFPDRHIKRIVGHKLQDITFGTYIAKGMTYETMRPVVEAIEWPTVEWSEL